MEDEPVVALAQDFDGDAPRLLRNKHGAEVVLSAFLHPLDVGRCGRGLLVEHALRLLDDSNRGDTCRIRSRELLLVPVEDASKDETRQNHRCAAAKLGHVDYAELAIT